MNTIEQKQEIKNEDTVTLGKAVHYGHLDFLGWLGDFNENVNNRNNESKTTSKAK